MADHTPHRSVFASFAHFGTSSNRSPSNYSTYRSPTATTVGGLDDDEELDLGATSALYGQQQRGRLTPSVANALHTTQQIQQKKDLMSYYDVDPVAVLQRLRASGATSGRRSDAQSSRSSAWHEPSIYEPIIESQRGRLVSASERKTPYDPLDADEQAPKLLFNGAINQQNNNRANGGATSPRYYVDRSTSEMNPNTRGGGLAVGAESTDVDYSKIPTPSWLSPKQPTTVNALPAKPLAPEMTLSRADVILFPDEAAEAKLISDSYTLSRGAMMVPLPGSSTAAVNGSAIDRKALLAARVAINGGDMELDLGLQDDMALDLDGPIDPKASQIAEAKKWLNELRWRPPPQAPAAPPSAKTAAQTAAEAKASPASPQARQQPTKADVTSSPFAHFASFETVAMPKPQVMVTTAPSSPAAANGPKAPPTLGGKAQPPMPAAPGKKGVTIVTPASPMSPKSAASPTATGPGTADASPASPRVAFIPPAPSVERPTLKQLEARAAQMSYNPASYQDYLFEKYLQESTANTLDSKGRPSTPSNSPARGPRQRDQQDVMATTQLIAVAHDPLRTGKFYDPFYSFRWWELGTDNDEVLKRGSVSSAGPHPETGVMMFADRFNNLTFGPYVLHPTRLWMVEYLAEKVTNLDDPILQKIDTLLVNNLSNVWEIEKMLVRKYGVPSSYATVPPSLKYTVEYPKESGITFVPLSEAMSQEMLVRQREAEEDKRLMEERMSSASGFMSGDESDASPPGSPRSMASASAPGSPTSPSSPSKKNKKGEVSEPASPASPGKKDKKGGGASEPASPSSPDKKDKKGKGDDKDEKKDKKDKGDKGDKKEKGDKKDKGDKKEKDGKEKKEKGDKKEKSDKKEKKK